MKARHRLTLFLLTLLPFIAGACADDLPVAPAAPEPDPSFALVVTPLDSARYLSVGQSHACALDTLSRGWCWGGNLSLQLGRASSRSCSGSDCSWVPLLVQGGHRFSQLAAGGGHTCGLEKETQYVWCWGGATFGRLGNNTSSGNSSVPVLADAGVEFVSVTASVGHSCALAVNGRIWCWGGNANGQSGGTDSQVLRPRVILGLRAYRMVSAGLNHTCAIDVDRRAWCWGSNSNGQLGDSASTGLTAVRSPVRVAGPGGWTWISAGDNYTCGIRAPGRVYCWGVNNLGQTGNAGPGGYMPTLIDASARFARVDAGASHACGLVLTGKLRCWGRGEFGEMGDSSFVSVSLPVAVRGRRGYADVSAGTNYACASSAHHVYCWGANFYGNVGSDPATTPCGTDPCVPLPSPIRRSVWAPAAD